FASAHDEDEEWDPDQPLGPNPRFVSSAKPVDDAIFTKFRSQQEASKRKTIIGIALTLVATVLIAAGLWFFVLQPYLQSNVVQDVAEQSVFEQEPPIQDESTTASLAQDIVAEEPTEAVDRIPEKSEPESSPP
ncbi:hypothetical protein RZS08_20475, partial [Arthrospira platensis SPKY1]|nr:hypothetical protein [Arthrospira platensis SPKY1]